MKEQRITHYADFFDFYLMEHRDRRCRALHYGGSIAGLSCLVLFAVTLDPWFLGVGFVAGYGPAWAGHFLFEKNRPATFRYPLWSFVSDFRMLWLWLTDRLDPALASARLRRDAVDGTPVNMKAEHEN
jgi:hypothetical protein